MKKVFFLLFCVLVVSISFGQSPCGLQSGPMPGHSDMLEVTIWLQTRCAQKVAIRYWEEGHPETVTTSRAVFTQYENAFTAHLVADQVKPGKRYTYEILLNDERVDLPYPLYFVTQQLWQWRKEPADFTFLAGSCTYINDEPYDRPGKPYGGGYEIFNAMYQEKPDMMMWLGDNVYLREVDWNSKTGIYYRYTHTRSLPELQPLLASTHHYAIWDDHDYGPNDADRSFWGKDMTLKAFKDFWANPNYGVGGTEGITGTFFWEDCQFFLLDDRWYRSPMPGKEYFGQTQLNWLVDALRSSKATFKFICTGGQILNDALVAENLSNFPEERKALFDSLDKYNITGVVFLTGDRHHSELSRMESADGDVWYDITSSALTSTTYDRSGEPNSYRVEGSIIGVRNYAVLKVSGPRKSRTCELTFKDGNGKVLFNYIIKLYPRQG